MKGPPIRPVRSIGRTHRPALPHERIQHERVNVTRSSHTGRVAATATAGTAARRDTVAAPAVTATAPAPAMATGPSQSRRRRIAAATPAMGKSVSASVRHSRIVRIGVTIPRIAGAKRKISRR